MTGVTLPGAEGAEGLWHIREDRLPVGAIIPPGRWGSIVLRAGAERHPLFHRELLMELWRLTQTKVQVSRLTCAFTWADRDYALTRVKTNQHVHRVEPTDPSAESVLVDALWIDWMGEPVEDAARSFRRLRSYWEGAASQSVTDRKINPGWERLFDCGLRVLDNVEPRGNANRAG